MAVMIAGVEIAGARAVRASEKRHIVHHHIPGFEGDVLQDIGRGPSVFVVEGVLHGASMQADVETLRARFRNGTPVELVASLSTALEVQDVLIRSLELDQIGGWPALMHARITAVEYIEPPRPQALAAPSLAADAASWGDALDTELTSEALARRMAADPLSAGTLLEQAGARSRGLREAVLAKAGGLLAVDPSKLSALLGSGVAPTELLAAVGGALRGDLDGVARIFGDLPLAQLGSIVGHLAKGDIAGALSGAADLLGDRRIGQILKTVAADPELMRGVIEIMRGNPQGLTTLARGVLGNPAVLSDVFGFVPELLDSIGMSDLASSIGESLEALTGVDITGIFRAIGDLDPAKLVELLEDLRDADSMAEIIVILAGGLGDRGDLGGAERYELGRAMLEAEDFVRKLQRVIDSGRALIDTVNRFKPIDDLRDLFEEMP